MTVAFLGDVQGSSVRAVAGILDRVWETVPTAGARSVGEPLLLARGRVVAADVELAPSGPMVRARAALLEQAAPFCPRHDSRPWRPHVTLVRASRVPRLAAARESELPVLSWPVDEVRLVASRVVDGRHRHETIHRVSLPSL